MESRMKRMIRILFLTMLVLFAAQFARARPAANHSKSDGRELAQAAEAPQKAQRQAAAAKPQAQAAPSDADQEEQVPVDPDVEKQLNDVRRQFENEALNRMRYGRPSGFDRFMDDFIPFLVFLGVTGALLWILRTVLDNRRWYKMVKVQTETHAKLLERFGSSQEMLAYMESDAGRKFLESPIFEGQRQQVSKLPFGRILWSVQIGIIAAFLGGGVLFLRTRVASDAGADIGFTVFGTLLFTLGIGFLVSGGVSYLLAKYFGLLERPEVALTRSGHNA
jgi:hypothetical protein